jgi:hypothetical protein
MDICEKIRKAHKGWTRCSVVDGGMNLVEAAGAFGLDPDPAIYRSIDRTQADEIATYILHVSLAYGVEIMSRSSAADLRRQFLALFQGQDVRFATNVGVPHNSWNPATDATFDMGVLVLGATRVGCLWVEDED